MALLGWGSAPRNQKMLSPRSKLQLTSCTWWCNWPMSGIGRERREHLVFLALLKSVPGLEEKLMSADSEDEIQSLAALVSWPCSTCCPIEAFSYLLTASTYPIATKRSLKCKIRWYKKFKTGNNRLAYTTWRTSDSSHCQKCKIWTWISSRGNRCTPLPDGNRLVRQGVSPVCRFRAMYVR